MQDRRKKKYKKGLRFKEDNSIAVYCNEIENKCRNWEKRCVRIMKIAKMRAKSADMACVNKGCCTGGKYTDVVFKNGRLRTIPYLTRVAKNHEVLKEIDHMFWKVLAAQTWHEATALYPELEQCMNIPLKHRLYEGCGWTAVACVGGIDNENHIHKDVKEVNWPGALVTLGTNICGGSTVYYNPYNLADIIEVPHMHYRVMYSRFGEIPHRGTKWHGARYCISYFVQNSVVRYFTE